MTITLEVKKEVRNEDVSSGKRIQTVLTTDEYIALKTLAIRQNKSLYQIVKEIICQWLKENKEGEKNG